MDKAAAWLNNALPSPSAEGFKALRTNLLFAAEEQDCRMILLAVPQEDPRAAHFAANLGATIACESRKVLLVDGDLRSGALTNLMDRENREVGLSAWMKAEKSIEDVVVSGGAEQLFLLPSGKSCADPAELFSEKSSGETLRSLREKYDYVIVYAPNVKSYTDAVALSRVCDGTVILFSAEKTKMGAAQKCKEALEAVKAPILGAVLNYF